jgi:hypothetical protein
MCKQAKLRTSGGKFDIEWIKFYVIFCGVVCKKVGLAI